jgi:hypothetical protein
MKFNKKVKVFGRSIPAVAIALIAIAALASAGLLTMYGMITGTATVSQSVLVDGQGYTGAITDTIPDVPGGEKFCFKHYLENKASVSASVNLERENVTCPNNDCEGVSTSYYKIEPKTTLTLCKKGADWKCTGATATLTFDTVNPKFVGTLNVTNAGLAKDTSYTLIYYADKEDRFTNWGGDNPGAVIKTFTYNGTNIISLDEELNMNLPSPPDKNIDLYNYCVGGGAGESYTHCHGAKIWLVPTADLTNENLPLINWNPTTYLFETDLITYLDCNKPVEEYFTTMYGEPVTSITIPSMETKDFLTCYDFAINIWPGTYTITTKVVPVV